MSYALLLLVAVVASCFEVCVCDSRHVHNKQPSPTGHFLTKTELDNVGSIACLQAKQRNPAVKCVGGQIVTAQHAGFSGDLSVTNFPNWKDPLCNSNDEFFCDPGNILAPEEQKKVAQLMTKQRAMTPVKCGILDHNPVEKAFFQPFKLGVVVIKDWPVSSSDPDTLNNFGMITAAAWNMTEQYRLQSDCPNLAMLIVLPDMRQAFLSTPSCEFICQERGGPEVVTSVLVDLDNHGTAYAVETGIKQVYHMLASVPAMSEARQVGMTTATAEGDSKKDVNADVWIFTQRLVFGVVVGLFALSIFVAGFVFSVAPGLAAKRGQL